MSEAILRLGDVELRTSDRTTVRTLYRLIATAVPPEELRQLEDEPDRDVPPFSSMT